jgi:hypothetical protein
MTGKRRDRETRSRRSIAIVGAVSALFLAACGSSSDSAGGSASPAQVTFTEVYAKVLKPCTSCHAGFVGQFDGLDVSTQATAYKNLVRVSASRCSGTLVIPKSAASSVLYEKITNPTCGSLMPQNAPALSQTEIDLVKNWIDEGAPND